MNYDFIILSSTFYIIIAIGAVFVLQAVWRLKIELLEYKALGEHLVRLREVEIELEAMKRTTHNIQFVDAETIRKQEFQAPPTEKELAAEYDPFSII